MLTLRQRVFIVGGVLIAVILVVLLLVRIFAQPAPTDTDSTSNTPINNVDSSLIQNTDTNFVPPDSNPPTFSDDTAKERFAKQMATLFVERFATYSNQNGNSHIEGVEAFVTTRMKQWVNTQQLEQSAEYIGVTSDVIAARLVSFSEQAAIVEVDVQQRVEVGTDQEIVQKSGTVNLVASGDNWLIDGFFWEE